MENIDKADVSHLKKGEIMNLNEGIEINRVGDYGLDKFKTCFCWTGKKWKFAFRYPTQKQD
jgi:hypothetical protein